MYKRLAEVRADEDVDADPRGAASTGTASRRRRSRACSQVARFRGRARQAGLTDVTAAGQVRPVRAGRAARLRRRCGSTGSTRRACVKPQVRTMLVPRPSTAVVGGQPIRDEALLTWAREVDRHGHRPRAGGTRRSRSSWQHKEKSRREPVRAPLRGPSWPSPPCARARRRAARTPARPPWSATSAISDEPGRRRRAARSARRRAAAQRRPQPQELASRARPPGCARRADQQRAVPAVRRARRASQPDQEQVSAALAANAAEHRRAVRRSAATTSPRHAARATPRAS